MEDVLVKCNKNGNSYIVDIFVEKWYNYVYVKWPLQFFADKKLVPGLSDYYIYHFVIVDFAYSVSAVNVKNNSNERFY